jgi:hypothetical protein
VLRRREGLKSFDEEIGAGGGLSGRAEAGTHPVPVEKIIGSVGRAQGLRSDFFYRRWGQVMTQRYRRIGELMQRGAALPPVDLYKLKRGRTDAQDSPATEYYVLDGHHRVAMARKLGQAYLDASVVEYRVAGDDSTGAASPGAPESDDADHQTPGEAPERSRDQPDETVES